MAAPLITLESAEQRNKMTLARSSFNNHFLKSAFGIALLFASVSIVVGKMQFTLILFSLNSCDVDSTNLINPAFDAAYAES
jgi:hypothetical protein